MRNKIDRWCKRDFDRITIVRWCNVIKVVISGTDGFGTATKEPPLYVSSDVIALSGY